MSEREREVGLGRVVEDRTGDDHRPKPDTDRQVERDSADSFPASDPPTWMSDPATPADVPDELNRADGPDVAPSQPPRRG